MQLLKLNEKTNEKYEKDFSNDILPDTTQVEKRLIKYECPKKKFLWWSWEECDTYYYPEGYIKYKVPNKYEPVKGVKIVMWRWFNRIEVVTYLC
ncbi:MAG: hypothetical protein IKJ22_07250 [Paludibacteraceae bacterium]|nr:hypothetical protein [Paludibacteraceae bacterium]